MDLEKTSFNSFYDSFSILPARRSATSLNVE